VLGGDPEKYRVPTKMDTGNQNKHQVSTKRPGGQQKPVAHGKELWVPSKMPGACKNATWPAKDTPGD